MKKLKIIIADDHPFLRKGLKDIITDQFLDVDIEEAATAEEVIKLVHSNTYDLLISDISMPGRSGIELLKQLQVDCPKLPVLILSMHSEEQYAIRAIKAGAMGYLTKETTSDELTGAIVKILSGRKYISSVVGELLAGNMTEETEQLSHESLSDRELEVMKLIATGNTIAEIATTLKISPNSVSTYRARVFKKMNFESTASLVKYAIEHELI